MPEPQAARHRDSAYDGAGTPRSALAAYCAVMAARDRDRRHLVVADVEPLDVDGVRSMVVGTLGWLLALVVLLPFTSALRDHGRLWWLWTCLTGVALGLLGLEYCRRRRNRLRR